MITKTFGRCLYTVRIVMRLWLQATEKWTKFWTAAHVMSQASVLFNDELCRSYLIWSHPHSLNQSFMETLMFACINSLSSSFRNRTKGLTYSVLIWALWLLSSLTTSLHLEFYWFICFSANAFLKIPRTTRFSFKFCSKFLKRSRNSHHEVKFWLN